MKILVVPLFIIFKFKVSDTLEVKSFIKFKSWLNNMN